MPRVSERRTGNMTEDVHWGKEGHCDSWAERGGQGLQIEGKGRVAKGQRSGSDSAREKKESIEERRMPILGWRMGAVKDGRQQDRKRFHSFPSHLH